MNEGIIRGVIENVVKRIPGVETRPEVQADFITQEGIVATVRAGTRRVLHEGLGTVIAYLRGVVPETGVINFRLELPLTGD